MPEGTAASGVVCADAGRQMFWDYAGRYFAKDITLKKAPAGTACSVCGQAGMSLWLTPQGMAVCEAQNAITSKRAGRADANTPAIPDPAASGMVALAEGALVLAGPHGTKIATKLLPQRDLPGDIDLQFPENGDRARWFVELLKNPPRPPFVFIVFGKNAGFTTEITTDASSIYVNGPPGTGGFAMESGRLAELTGALDGVKWKVIEEACRLRARLATGQQARGDDEALEKLRSDNRLFPLFRNLPTPGTPTYQILRNLFNQ
jgi:hypothetical protein